MPSDPVPSDPGSILAQSLTLPYSPTTGIRDISFSCTTGVTALVGNNGAGKTTLMETLAGLRTPVSGMARISSYDPIADKARLRTILGVALQDVTPYPTAKPRELLTYLGSLYPHPEPVDRLLVDFSIPADSPIKNLSGGQVQRLKAAMALIGRPQVVLLDEPTAGLDPTGRTELHHNLRERANHGAVILVSTHLTEDIDAIAERSLVLSHGSLIADLHASQIEKKEFVDFTAKPQLPVDQLASAMPTQTDVIAYPDGRYHISSPNPVDSHVIATIESWCRQHGTVATDMSWGRASLASETSRVLRGSSTGGGES